MLKLPNHITTLFPKLLLEKPDIALVNDKVIINIITPVVVYNYFEQMLFLKECKAILDDSLLFFGHNLEDIEMNIEFTGHGYPMTIYTVIISKK